jgi:hypothetical protein
MGAGELWVKDLGFGAAADPPSSNIVAVKWQPGVVGHPASFSVCIPPLTRRNSPLKSRNMSLIYYVSACLC